MIASLPNPLQGDLNSYYRFLNELGERFHASHHLVISQLELRMLLKSHSDVSLVLYSNKNNNDSFQLVVCWIVCVIVIYYIANLLSQVNYINSVCMFVFSMAHIKYWSECENLFLR